MCVFSCCWYASFTEHRIRLKCARKTGANDIGYLRYREELHNENKENFSGMNIVHCERVLGRVMVKFCVIHARRAFELAWCFLASVPSVFECTIYAIIPEYEYRQTSYMHKSVVLKRVRIGRECLHKSAINKNGISKTYCFIVIFCILKNRVCASLFSSKRPEWRGVYVVCILFCWAPHKPPPPLARVCMCGFFCIFHRHYF